MITREQIDNEIAKEAALFNAKVYDGMPLPKDIMEKFKAGIMRGGTKQPELIKGIVSKRHDELTWMEVGMITNYVSTLPYEINFVTLEEALDYAIYLQKVMVSYNEVTNKANEDLEKKRELKYRLAGFGNNTAKFAVR